MRVALPRSPVIFHAAARAIRPPSSGKAGTRLNTSSSTLAETRKLSHSSNGPVASVRSSRAASQNPPAPSSAIDASEPTTTISNVTSGPAAATRNSWPGVEVSRLIFITPPKKKRSMPATSIPSRRAASAWPSSCSRIEPKKPKAVRTATMKPCWSSPSSSANGSWSQKMARNRITNHEMLTPTRIPKIVARRMELPPSTECQWWHSLPGWLTT